MGNDSIGFLHRHPLEEYNAGLSNDHVIVDKKDWNSIRSDCPQFIHIDVIRISMIEMLENLPDTNRINLANTLILISQRKQEEYNAKQIKKND